MVARAQAAHGIVLDDDLPARLMVLLEVLYHLVVDVHVPTSLEVVSALLYVTATLICSVFCTGPRKSRWRTMHTAPAAQASPPR